jgi:hypothetical protein
LRRFAFALLAAIAWPGLSEAVRAQSCAALQGELVHLQSQGGGTSADRARYERAFREQTNVLARTEARARNAGCFGGGGFLFFRRNPQAICATLVPKLAEMRNNLDRLDTLRRRAGSDDGFRIRQLQNMLAVRDCDASGDDPWGGGGDPWAGSNVPYSPSGTYRTLCVRACDGYYFPISFATTQDQFGADAHTCASMCPGSEVSLYFHANPGGGPEDMTSLEGALYADLPTAFKYRTSVDSSCTCTPFGNTTIAANPRPSLEPEDLTAPVPRPRPEPGEDPETLADRAGNFVPGSVSATSAAAGAPKPSGSRTVRIVGPADSSDQNGILLKPVVPN